MVLCDLLLLNLVLGTPCFGALVWYEDEECVHHRPMSVFNRLPGIRDFPTRNPAVLRSIACKILRDQILYEEKNRQTNPPAGSDGMGIKTFGC